MSAIGLMEKESESKLFSFMRRPQIRKEAKMEVAKLYPFTFTEVTFNLLLTCGLVHPYYLDEAISSFMKFWVDVSFLLHRKQTL